MALDRILHGHRRPRTEVERILELYREGRLPLGEATGLLWLKGMSAEAAHAMLTGNRPHLDAVVAALDHLGKKG